MKNERISNAAKYVREKFRSFAAILRALRRELRALILPKHRTTDFGHGGRPEVIMLREKTWKFEVNRTKAKKFFRQHKAGLAVTLAVVVALVVTRYAIVGFASTVDFFPSSCLGNWENVQNALGTPSLTPDAPQSAFTTLNSAVFGTSSAQMFCGNFSGNTDIATLEGKAFQSASLVLSWSFTFPQQMLPMPQGSPAPQAPVVSSTAPSGAGSGGDSGSGGSGGGAGGGGGASPSPAPPPTPTPASTSTPDTSGDSGIASSTDTSGTMTNTTSTTDVDTGSASSTQATSSTDDTAASPTSTNETASSSSSVASSTPPPPTPPAAPAPTPSSMPTSSDNSASSSNANQTPTPTPTPAPTSTPTPTPAPTPAPTPDPANSSSSPTSWLRKLIGIAYADQTSSSVITAASASTTQFANSSTSVANSSTPLTIASSAQEGIPSTGTTQLGTINVNTSMFQNIILPSSSANAVLAIVYSTDGVTWQPLVNVDASNWQQKRYPIPITSWQELEHLQVAFVGLGTSNSPQIFLDSAGVEVSYADSPDATTDITPEDQEATTTSPDPTLPEDIVQKPTISESDVFQQGAHQQCVAAPFSQALAPGGTASYEMDLFSGLTTSSTPPKATTSTANAPVVYQHAVYQTQIGSLPVGISAAITDGPTSDVSSTQNLKLSALSNASAGSYSILFIYRERQDDASMRSTGCQLNVVVQ